MGIIVNILDLDDENKVCDSSLKTVKYINWFLKSIIALFSNGIKTQPWSVVNT